MKRIVYLISPNRINKDFFYNLDKVLSVKNVKFFQLRLKKIKPNSLLKIAKKIKKITKKHKVKLIINDNYILASKVKSDGCHMGQLDGNIIKARKKLRNKILGVTCHSSKTFAENAIKNKADYIALGAFNLSKTKKVKYKATIEDLKKFRKLTNKSIVAIGGINQYNYKKLLLNKADFLAISNFIWKNKNFKPEEAIKKLK